MVSPQQITQKKYQPIITQPVIKRTIVHQPLIQAVIHTKTQYKPRYIPVPQKTTQKIPVYSTNKPIVETKVETVTVYAMACK